MIIYSESFHVEKDIEQEWVQWMKDVIIPEIHQTGKFSKAVFAKVVSHSDKSGDTYSVQYYAKDKKELNDFYSYHYPKISQLLFNKFGTQVLPFKTELDIIEIFDF
ncbi:MAG: DUF4286 family protein [Flavobacteriaceae bacterium]|jgi:hypothetical protein|nr:DUF4286 family protein [Flavobacteriaceae bacterium]